MLTFFHTSRKWISVKFRRYRRNVFFIGIVLKRVPLIMHVFRLAPPKQTQWQKLIDSLMAAEIFRIGSRFNQYLPAIRIAFLLLDLARRLLIYWIIFCPPRAQKALTSTAWTLNFGRSTYSIIISHGRRNNANWRYLSMDHFYGSFIVWIIDIFCAAGTSAEMNKNNE